MADVPTTDLPDPDHRTPAGVDDATVEALGKLSEALETCERARGHLYSFHQLTGSADIELAAVGPPWRHASPTGSTASSSAATCCGRWTFQIVEEYDDTYWSRSASWSSGRDELAAATPPVRGSAQAGRADCGSEATPLPRLRAWHWSSMSCRRARAPSGRSAGARRSTGTRACCHPPTVAAHGLSAARSSACALDEAAHRPTRRGAWSSRRHAAGRRLIGDGGWPPALSTDARGPHIAPASVAEPRAVRAVGWPRLAGGTPGDRSVETRLARARPTGSTQAH